MAGRKPLEESVAEDGRAAALSDLMGSDVEFFAAREEPLPVPVEPTGYEVKWDGSTKFLVIGDMFTAVVDDDYKVATKGTTVLLSADTARIGVDTGVLQKL